MSLGRLRVVTAGESHGPQLTIFVENLPAGHAAAGRGRRRRPGAAPERLRPRWAAADRARLRRVRRRRAAWSDDGRSRSPWWSRIAIGPTGRARWTSRRCPSRHRRSPVCGPGHADLAGVVKYGLDDVRNVLERASARETASRVAAGGLAKAFLRQFGIDDAQPRRAVDRHARRPTRPSELALARDGASHAWWRRSRSRRFGPATRPSKRRPSR